MQVFKCSCGHPYTLLPDEDADDLPPSFLAKFMRCDNCEISEWLEPQQLDLESWPDN